MKNPPTIEIQSSKEDNKWIKGLLEKGSTKMVLARSQEAQDTEAGWIKARQERQEKEKQEQEKQEERKKAEWAKSKIEQEKVILVSSTSSAHQDAGTIRVDPEARRRVEKGKRAEKGKKKANRSSPPITRSRKRTRQTTTEDRTASQDSCKPRNPFTGGNALGETDTNIVEGPGYTPPSTQEVAQMVEAKRVQTQIAFVE